MDARVPASDDTGIDEVIAAATQIAQRKAPKSGNKAAFVRFITQFYRGSPPEELKGRTAQALYDDALAAWAFLQERPLGK